MKIYFCKYRLNTCWLTLILFFFTLSAFAQLPAPALIGYWQNWQDANSPYIQLDQVDNRYNIIDVAFAVPGFGTDYRMEFIPDQVTLNTLHTQVQNLQSMGKKVLISAGGATAPISLNNAMERDSFCNSMLRIINTYGFDGMDIDFEGSSLSVSGGSISAPVDASIINLVASIRQMMTSFYAVHGKKMILTMAPETAFVQGGMSAYGGIWGAYLPVIDALRDSIDVLHVQLYNSGSMYGADGGIYNEGTADFIVAMSEAVIHGFNTAGGMFNGLPASKVAIGLPACTSAAGGGYVAPQQVKLAMDYLLGTGTQPGTYSLFNSAGYPDFRGMMTWSVNWDAVSSCGAAYSYAANYDSIFNSTTAIPGIGSKNNFLVAPLPVQAEINLTSKSFQEKSSVKLFSSTGELLESRLMSGNLLRMDCASLSAGIYVLQIGGECVRFIKE